MQSPVHQLNWMKTPTAGARWTTSQAMTENAIDKCACLGYYAPSLSARPGSSGVEQRIENPRVGGSIPPPGTISLRSSITTRSIMNGPPASKLGILHFIHGRWLAERNRATVREYGGQVLT